ncbi:MAG: hypothetical protein LUF82_06660 [Clostridia bacterium]|nr:hypothetical protein [Clostridia bacterium]
MGACRCGVGKGIGQVIGGVIPFIYFAKNNGSLLKFVKTKLEIKPLLKACANGISELLTNISASAVSILYNLQLMKFIGEDGVSAYGVLMYVQLVFFAIEIGYSIGSAPIIAYNYGSGNKAELKSMFKKSMLILCVSGVVLSGLAQALAYPLAKLFVGYDKELFTLTVSAFRKFSFSFIFSGITIFASGFFTALSNGFISAVLSVLRSLVFQIIFIYLLPHLFGVDGIWWAMFATEACAFTVSFIMFYVNGKRYGYM